MKRILKETVQYFKAKAEHRVLSYNSFISGGVLYYNGSSIAKWDKGEAYIRYTDPTKSVLSRLKALGAKISVRNKQVYRDNLPMSSHDWHKL